MKYMEQINLITSNEKIGTKEAYYNALNNPKYNPNETFTFTTTGKLTVKTFDGLAWNGTGIEIFVNEIDFAADFNETEIPDYAFSSFNSLTKITLPSCITTVNSDSFGVYTLLEEVHGSFSKTDMWTFEDGTLTIHVGYDSESAECNLMSLAIIVEIEEDVDEYDAWNLCFPSVKEVSIPSNWSLDSFSSMFSISNFPTIYYYGDCFPEETSESSNSFYSIETDAETGDSRIYGASSFVMYVSVDIFEEFEQICAAYAFRSSDVGTEAHMVILPMSFSKYGRLSLTESNNGIYAGNEQNPYLVLVEEVDKTKKGFRINSQTRVISSFAFYSYDNNNLKRIDIPDSVQYIGSCAFTNCTNITDLGIGTGLKYIGLGAFSYISTQWVYDYDLGMGSYVPVEASTMTIYLRKTYFANEEAQIKFATDLASALTDKFEPWAFYEYMIYGEYFGAFEYIIGENEGYNEGYNLDGATMRPVVINYHEDLEAFAQTFGEILEEVSGSEYVTLNATDEQGIQFPETGIKANVSVAVASIVLIGALWIILSKKKENNL